VWPAEGLSPRSLSAVSHLPNGNIGSAAETATKQAAMYWGLPDFVYRSVVRPRGRGVRELGDVIVCVSDVAAVVQVKARATVSADSQREASWLAKKIPQAIRQARGTLRSLAAEKTVELINERGNRVKLNCAAKSWVAVVLIDHPNTGCHIPESGAVVLLRCDWDFLFGQLKSTDAVLRYLHLVQGEDPILLGREPARYHDLAKRSDGAPAGPIKLAGLAAGAIKVSNLSTPMFPQAPAGSEGISHHILRWILEDIAEMPRPENTTEAEFLDILAAIDTMAVGFRSELGRLLVTWLAEVSRVPSWRSRLYVGEKPPYLIFATGTNCDEKALRIFQCHVASMHLELTEAHPELKRAVTVGILLAPQSDGLRPWGTTIFAVSGNVETNPEIKASLDAVWR
jgi:hypothetical protein